MSQYGNKVLYNMCKDEPLHQNIDIIASKLWIIGRSYAAAIERKAGVNFKIEDAARIIQASDIDKHLVQMQKVDRLDNSNVNLSLEVHHIFANLLRDATGIVKRSLASKYLHFHAPNAFFIYDSIANTKIRKALKREQSRFTISKSYDDEYESFVRRCLYYRNNILEMKLKKLATPRRVDMELLGYK